MKEQLMPSIETLTPKEIETMGKQKMIAFQLEYCQCMWEKKIPLIDPKYQSFEDIIRSCSELTMELYTLYFARVGNDTDYDSFQEIVLDKVHAAYDANPAEWISQIPAILTAAIEALPKGAEQKEQESNQEHSNRAGLIRYDIISIADHFEKFGLSPEDIGPENFVEAANIHFKAFFKQKESQEDQFSLATLAKSLATLAEQLQAKYPEVKLIYAESWLLDSPIGKKIGFHTFVGPNEKTMYGFGFWGQFIDQHGQLKEDAMKDFLETGKARYSVKAGYISINEFFAKYLPKSKEVLVS